MASYRLPITKVGTTDHLDGPVNSSKVEIRRFVRLKVDPAWVFVRTRLRTYPISQLRNLVDYFDAARERVDAMGIITRNGWPGPKRGLLCKHKESGKSLPIFERMTKITMGECRFASRHSVLVVRLTIPPQNGVQKLK